mgnify:CR=1 FL=1
MPKMIEIPVYTIGELSEKARDKAHSDYLSCGDYSDNIDTIKSFCDLFDIDLQNCSIDSCSYSYDATIPQQRNITKRKALAMVNSWEITQGYFLASIACDAIKDTWENGDIKLAIEDALESMFLACQRELEYYESVECFVESCEANEWTFLESGELFYV